MKQKTEVKIVVIWQSLVVKAYRSLFRFLVQETPWHIALVAPQRFSELGFQDTPCEPFDPHPQTTAITLKAWAPHTQVVLFRGLKRSLKRFFTPKPATTIILCIAEPYSITALWGWLWTRVMGGGRSFFVLYAAQNIAKGFPAPLKWVRKLMYKKTNAILSLGHAQTEVLRKSGYYGPVIPFPLWFDSSLFRPLDPPQLPSKKLVVGFVGALNHQKGLTDLIEAIAKAPWRDQVHLRIVGKGPLQEEVTTLLTQLPSSEMLGSLKAGEMPSFYQSLHLLAVPSRTMPHIKEQFGRVIIEAWACGASVIGSSSGEIPKVIDDDSRIFPEGEPDSIAHCIHRVLEELHQHDGPRKLRQEALTKAEYYSDKSCARRLAANINELLRNS